jgi:hypothetical protein
MRAFINYWFEHAEGSIEIAYRNPATKKIDRAAHFDIRDPALENFACDVNMVEGQDVYFTPAVVSNLRGRASDQDFVCSPGFWVDQDKLDHINHANSIQHEFYPTSYVYTGRTPDPRRQCWFRLDQPTTDAALVRDTNARLLHLYKGDASVVNPSRLMRLPGGISWPWKPGRTPELVSWDHPTDGRRRSHQIALASTLPEPAPQLVTHNESNGQRPTVSELLDRIKANDNWHVNMVQLVGHWIGRGWSDTEILVWASEITLPGYDIDQTADEMQTAISGGRIKWGQPDIDRVATTRFEDAVAAFAGAVALPTLPDDSIFELLSLESLAERHGKIPDMMIDGFLTRGSMTMMTGLPGTGKSPLAQHMVVCVALGVPWAGLPTKQGCSLYIAAESHSQTAMNLSSLVIQELERLWDCPGVVSHDQAVKYVDQNILTLTSGFLIESDTPRLLTTIDRELAPGGRWAGRKGPDVFVLDTLRAMSTGSVNDDADMVAVQMQIGNIKRRYPEACGVLLNHSPKGDPEGSLGSNRLDAFSEIIVNITHKKPHAGANDDTVLKRPERIGPNADGWVYSPLAVTVQRNKTWTVSPPMRATLAIKDNTLRLLYEAESMAAERPAEGDQIETPFNAAPQERKVKRRPVKIPDAVRKASDAAINRQDWIIKVLEAANVQLSADAVAHMAFELDPLIFMGNSDARQIGEDMSDLAEQGKIIRHGGGRSTIYSGKDLKDG